MNKENGGIDIQKQLSRSVLENIVHEKTPTRESFFGRVASAGCF